MSQDSNSKKYDLEDRTYNFALSVRKISKQIKLSSLNIDDVKQVLRSSGSIAANYIEANESLSKKDFILRIKICRKESKETVLWLRLLSENDTLKEELQKLIVEAAELMKIFGAILVKSK